MTIKSNAIIIGAGPAGLTAAYELLTKTDITPIVFETSNYVGGISKTIEHHGNRMDIGGHRFFSKSDVVMDWWKRVLPITSDYHSKNKDTFLLRHRLSRIYFLRHYFDYPISLNIGTMQKLGAYRILRMVISYIYRMLFPIKPEKNLEDFFLNRFGRVLYLTFFKSYTEKVWGISCNKISPAWGAQRIKGLSITRSIWHIVRRIFPQNTSDLSQKKTENSLIEQFLYPALGPGQLWEKIASLIEAKGGVIYKNHHVRKVLFQNDHVTGVEVEKPNGDIIIYNADYIFSTMPIKDLFEGVKEQVPNDILEIASNLVYRDFISIGLLCPISRLKSGLINGHGQLVRDNWIYIQEPEVKIGRLQIFNNWSPYMVSHP